MKITAQLLLDNGINELPDHKLEARYCETLNEVYGMVKIAGYEYETADALASIDPVAFRCGLADFISSELDETIEEIDGKYFDLEDVRSVASSLEES